MKKIEQLKCIISLQTIFHLNLNIIYRFKICLSLIENESNKNVKTYL